jgi:hypothetical protein
MVQSPQRVAKVAGLAYLLSFAAVVFVQFHIHDRLIISADAAATDRNILDQERLFRIGIACDLGGSISLAIWLTALYLILSPVNRGLALFAAVSRLVYVFMWLFMLLNLFDALRVLKSVGPLPAADAAQWRALSMLYLGERFDQYYVGLLFTAIASAVCSYLWFISAYIPKALAAFGFIASVFCAACTAIFVIFPDFDKIVNLWWFDTPMGIFDMISSSWLLVKGVNISYQHAL